jgi:hypothetical protein
MQVRGDCRKAMKNCCQKFEQVGRRYSNELRSTAFVGRLEVHVERHRTGAKSRENSDMAAKSPWFVRPIWGARMWSSAEKKK